MVSPPSLKIREGCRSRKNGVLSFLRFLRLESAHQGGCHWLKDVSDIYLDMKSKKSSSSSSKSDLLACWHYISSLYYRFGWWRWALGLFDQVLERVVPRYCTWSGESPPSLLEAFSLALALALASGVILITWNTIVLVRFEVSKINDLHESRAFQWKCHFFFVKKRQPACSPSTYVSWLYSQGSQQPWV